MRQTLSLAFSLLFSLVSPSVSLAQEEAPDALMKRISEEIIGEIRHDKHIQAGDSAKIAALVDAKVIPHFDFRRITQMAMGANWRKANPRQQDRLTGEFKTLLVRTYSGALASYRGQQIQFLPLRAAAGDTEVTVKSRVKQAGTEPIAIEYDLARTGREWKVFDVRIGGISLVANYRSVFAEEVRNNGVDGLIALLSKKNAASVALR
ncbi:MAG: ABC transporter substrate-binding protein [Betaproteobacteria bacterium]|nr:MAG: ABC transporter substrate-binding protein [Betaproteobacteria bacterium]